MTCHILTIGDELLIGQVIDTNSAWMAQRLGDQGIRVTSRATVGDVHTEIVAALVDSAAKADLILLTGGLGPTKDDITKKAIAEFFGVGMTFHQETFDRIERYLAQVKRPLTEDLRQQCFMPANGLILKNDLGTAPGMWFEHEGKIWVSMPGVPYEMEYLMNAEVLPRLRESDRGIPFAHRTVLTVGEGENVIAGRIADWESSLPPHLKLAYLPSLGVVRLQITGRDTDEAALGALLDSKKAELVALLSDIIFGEGDETLESVIGKICLAKNLKIGTAESCTGGYMAHRITTVPGSSAYFLGSVVSYANDVKMKVLGVRPETLAAFGAVSEATVREMVTGALDALGVDVALAISGIAGPGGGSVEKPVGTVWVAVGNRQEIRTRSFRFGRDRLRNIQLFGNYGLNELRKFLLTC